MTNPYDHWLHGGRGEKVAVTRLAEYDTLDVAAVAHAYRHARLAGGLDPQASHAAMDALRQRHPDWPEERVRSSIAGMIATAARKWGPWVYGRD